MKKLNISKECDKCLKEINKQHQINLDFQRKEIIEELIGKAIWINYWTEKWNEKFVDFIDIRLKKEDWDK